MQTATDNYNYPHHYNRKVESMLVGSVGINLSKISTFNQSNLVHSFFSSAGGAAAGASPPPPPVFSSCSIIFCFSMNIALRFSRCFSRSSSFMSGAGPPSLPGPAAMAAVTLKVQHLHYNDIQFSRVIYTVKVPFQRSLPASSTRPPCPAAS